MSANPAPSFGAIFIGLAIYLIPILGAATFISVLIAGQMLTSVAFDHFGWLGLEQRTVDLPRLIGAGFVFIWAFSFQVSATQTCRCWPKHSIPSSTTSPAFRYCGGFIPSPTPGGVPVETTSPGCRVKNCDR